MNETTIMPVQEHYSPQGTIQPFMLDPANEQEFNRLAELAAFSCNCPLALISFAGIQKQWLSNATARHIPFNHQLNYALSGDEVLVITDVINDERCQIDPCPSEAKNILFYAATGIVAPDGRLLGTLAVMDTAPRNAFTNDQKKALKTIAGLVVRLLKLKVANRFMNRQAEQLADTEKKMHGLIISEQETEKIFIAHKLQEHFAQTLAATKLYLEYAGQTKEDKDEFISKSVQSIAGVIDEIKYLCKTMVPSTLGDSNPVELLEDMIAEWETRHHMSIDFTCGTSLRSINGPTGLAVFRIIQQQLKLVSCCEAPKAEISILQNKGLVLYFTMKDFDLTDGDSQKELFINSINAWVEIANGKMTIDRTLSANDVMQISIPVQGRRNRKN